MSIDIAIAGATGRMGTRLLALLERDQELRACAATCSPTNERIGCEIQGAPGLKLAPTIDTVFDVLLDFSTPASTSSCVAHCVEHRRPIVIGTTGHSDSELDEIRAAAQSVAIVLAPNTSIGVNVLLRAVREVGAALPAGPAGFDVSIVDVHHRHKVDSPSGTALALRKAVEEVRTGDEEIPINSLRLGGRPGDHSVLFGSEDELLVLSHSAQDRDAFARGALRAARWVLGRKAGLYDMQDVLFSN